MRRSATGGRAVAALVVVLLLAGLWVLSGQGSDWFADARDPGASSSSSTDPESGLPRIDEDDLPEEARETLELIDDGGPYPYQRDGIVFGNREGILPDRPRGTYHEYTVETPGIEHRGARRIVTGRSGEFFWTEDHYESFESIRR
ncbi:MAG TPA: ribonuclease domain-containing protein [Nocardioides sp.]